MSFQKPSRVSLVRLSLQLSPVWNHKPTVVHCTAGIFKSWAQQKRPSDLAGLFDACSYSAEPLMDCQRGQWRIVHLLKGTLSLLSRPVTHSPETHVLANAPLAAQGFLWQALQIFCHLSNNTGERTCISGTPRHRTKSEASVSKPWGFKNIHDYNKVRQNSTSVRTSLLYLAQRLEAGYYAKWLRMDE